jgi:hypothetical protein
MPDGWDSGSNTYYLGGEATTLDQNGTGDWNGLHYEGGNPATGYYGSYYYINGYQTTLDAYGSGSWQKQPNGGYAYFLNGDETTLDPMSGSGVWNGLVYYQGNQQPTGWNGSYYYIDNVQTTLIFDGSGTWNGYEYVNGTKRVVGSLFDALPGDLGDPNAWKDSNGLTATEYPVNGDITITGVVNANSVGNTWNVVTLTGSASIQAGMSASLFKFYGSSTVDGGCTVTGNCEFYDNSTIVAGSSVTGDATFHGNSVNKNGISGTVTASHGGGINGSSILGIP